MVKISTYEKQSCLPRLPIPPLNETLEKFLSTVEPLLSKSSMQKTREEVAEFLENDGPKLQCWLETYDKEGRENNTHGSYIEEMWSNAYLVAPDTSVVLNLNPFFLLEEDPDARIGKNQILRAASLTFHSLRLAASLRNETLVPDSFKGTTLCMDQFRSLFGSCRVPMAEKDMVEVDLESDHVLVLFRNQFYYFRALWSKDEADGECRVAVDESDIIQILSRIVQDGKSTPLEESIENALGALTSLPRKMWAVTRSQLIDMSEQNASVLDIIDTALFVLVLDDYVPENVHDAAANMLHGTHFMKKRKSLTVPNTDENASYFGHEYMAGTCCNRWYDKLQIIVCSDGSAGVNFEHSAIDGHTALRFASDVFAETIVTFAKSITKSIYTKECPIPRIIDAKFERSPTFGHSSDRFDSNPVKISFDLHGKIKERIFHAETALGDAISADDTYVLEFSRFGKLFIVGNKFSPDSLVQASIQIAYYRLYGDIVCAYESVMTKAFYHGRTEAARSTTSKSVELCKCWMNAFSTKEDKVKALREATVMHSKLVLEASEGKGVDRHLYALKCIAEMKGASVPNFFSSDAWIALNHTVLSTSNCGNPALKLFGFGPVVPDGFGIGYIIKDNSIHFSISSKHRQTRRFSHALNETLIEIYNHLEPIEVSNLSHHSSLSSKHKNAATANGSANSVEFSDAFDDTYGEKILELKKCESDEYTKLSSLVRAHSLRSSASPSMRSSFVGLAKPMNRR